MKIFELATLVDGTVEGDGEIDILALSGIESAKNGDLTFAMDDERLTSAEQSLSSCVLTTKTARKSTKPLIRVSNPKLAFLISYNTLHQHTPRESFIHPSAIIARTVQLGNNVWIDANVSIKDHVVIADHTIIESGTTIKEKCSIGQFCHIHPNVVLYENTQLKNNVILHSGCVVGSDGFGYVRNKGKIYKFPQMGKVIIEDDVEIGSNCTIDKGSLSDTIIGQGGKIDNLCHIAHNVKIGKNFIMAAQSGIAGSSVIADNVTVSGQVAITDNIKIGNNVTIGGKSCVIGSIKDNEIVWGYPARALGQSKKQLAVVAWMTKNFSNLSKIIKHNKKN